MGDFGFYFGIGWDHIMSVDALDHLLFIFVLCAVYEIREWRKVAILVTAFTLGHSLTLALSALQLVRVPDKWVEFAIPVTILLTALSNLGFRAGRVHRMWRAYTLAAVFGLVHGLGFANTLRFMLATNQNFGWSLFGFNVGLEAGQLLVVMIFLFAATLVLRFLKASQRDWVLFVSASVFGVALKMALERLPF